MKGMRRRDGRGFSLIELMFVLAITAIIVSVSMGYYQRYVAKNNRAQAKARMAQAAQLLERFYSDNSSYYVDLSGGNVVVNTGGSTAAGFAALMSAPTAAPSTVYSGSNNEVRSPYTVALTTPNASSWTLTATPQAGTSQAGDMCGNLTLTSTGVKGIASLPAGSTATLSDCW